jgi:hypothetical protein
MALDDGWRGKLAGRGFDVVVERDDMFICFAFCFALQAGWTI